MAGCAVALVLCVSAQQPNAWFHRVDDHIYRGKQPGKADIPVLAAAGIKTVLDLRGALGHQGWEKAAVEGAGMKYMRIGLSGVLPPTEHQIDEILALLQNSAQGPVYIHCRRGSDRSGLVIACYRMVYDHWTNAQALQEAREQGFSRLEVLMRRYIEHFKAPAAASGDPH